MEFAVHGDAETLNSEYSFIVKNKTDILNELNFTDDEDRFITDSIITNLEKHASESIRNGKAAQLPYIGVVRKNPLREIIRANYNNFKVARKHMTKEEYKEYASETINLEREKLIAKEKKDLIIKRLISRNKKKYDRLYIELGKHYATVYILSLYWMEAVEFDQDVQDMYDSLKS